MLPPHTITSITLLVSWNLFAAFTCILFYLHRDVPLIFHRNVPLSLIVAIAGTCLIDLHLFRLIFKSSFPCFLILWIPAFILPTLVFTMLTRFVFLAKEYWQNKYDLAMHDAVYTVMEGKLTRKNSVTYQDTSEYGWRLRVGGWFTYRSIKWMAVIFVTCQAVSMIVVSVYSTRFRWDVSKCVIGYELGFIYGWVFVALLVAPIAAVLMVGVQENYGIKLELYTGAFVFFTLCLAGAVLDFTPTTMVAIKSARKFVGSHHLLMFGLVFIHVMYIVVPAIKVWRDEHFKLHATEKEHQELAVEKDLESADFTKEGLHALFDDDERMQAFRRFAVLDFSVRQLIFYKKWKEARELVEMGGYWQPLYKQMYEEFLVEGAPNQLEVDEGVQRQMAKQFADEHYTSDMLDRAASSVFDAIYAETFPRFLASTAVRRKVSGVF